MRAGRSKPAFGAYPRRNDQLVNFDQKNERQTQYAEECFQLFDSFSSSLAMTVKTPL